MAFEKNVFINCPFDEEYSPLLRPLLFTVLYLEFEPKISQTISSSDIRINQIKQHIRESKFAIHDLSRCRPMKNDELPRFNMPFELGLDVGCAEYGQKKFSTKKVLILESEKYHYQKVLSDIAGQDIADHNNDPKTLIQRIRNWFSTNDDIKPYPSANLIYMAYDQFYEDLIERLNIRGFAKKEIEEMPMADFIKWIREWIRNAKHTFPHQTLS